MLIVALVLAVIGLAALVTAVVTSNELVAWVCIAASVLGVILLIVDAIRERQSRDRVSVDAEDGAGALAPAAQTVDETYENFDAEYPNDTGSVELPTNRHAPYEVAPTSTSSPTPMWSRTPNRQSRPSPPNRMRCPRCTTRPPMRPTSDMEVRYVTSEEPDTGVEYVSDGERRGRRRRREARYGAKSRASAAVSAG